MSIAQERQHPLLPEFVGGSSPDTAGLGGVWLKDDACVVDDRTVDI